MRYIFAVLAILMLLAIVVQYNDPDGTLWMAYYAIPLVWCTLAVVRPSVLASRHGRALLGVSVVVMVALTIFYWPTAAGFWHERVWQMGLTDPEAARVAEESREGMGMMIATATLLVVAVWSVLARGNVASRSPA